MSRFEIKIIMFYQHKHFFEKTNFKLPSAKHQRVVELHIDYRCSADQYVSRSTVFYLDTRWWEMMSDVYLTFIIVILTIYFAFYIENNETYKLFNVCLVVVVVPLFQNIFFPILATTNEDPLKFRPSVTLFRAGNDDIKVDYRFFVALFFILFYLILFYFEFSSCSVRHWNL